MFCSPQLNVVLVKRDYVKSHLSYSVKFLNWSEADYMDMYLFSAGGDIWPWSKGQSEGLGITEISFKA